MVDELQLITGIDVPVEELGITIRQPSIKEISMLGEVNYFTALQLFTITKESVNIVDENVTNWMIFQKSIEQEISGVTDTKTLILNFLQLFFNCNINFGPRSLILMDKDGIKNIEPEDFDTIQQLIGSIGGKSLLSAKEEKFKPKNKRAAEIVEKMKKARERLAKVKAVENGTDKMENKGFLARYIRAVATVTANSLEQVNSMTILQLNSLMQTYLAWEAYDLDIKSRLAGAKNDKEIVHWTMMDIEGKQNDSIGTI